MGLWHDAEGDGRSAFGARCATSGTGRSPPLPAIAGAPVASDSGSRSRARRDTAVAAHVAACSACHESTWPAAAATTTATAVAAAGSAILRPPAHPIRVRSQRQRDATLCFVLFSLTTAKHADEQQGVTRSASIRALWKRTPCRSFRHAYVHLFRWLRFRLHWRYSSSGGRDGSSRPCRDGTGPRPRRAGNVTWCEGLCHRCTSRRRVGLRAGYSDTWES